MSTPGVPEQVALATERAARAGFTMSCDPGTGRLLSVLAAAVPAGGRVLELGPGTGVGTAWLVHGLSNRDDAEVVTVELDPARAALAAAGTWPAWVRFRTGDALAILPAAGQFDLIFADAPGGKWDGLDTTVAALRPGGLLLVDDMTPGHYSSDEQAIKITEIRDQLLGHPDLVSVELAWSSGLILSARKPPG